MKAKDHLDLKNVFSMYGYKQLIDSATRITESSKTLIDVIQTNKSNNISSTAVFPSSLSDHDLIGCVRKLHNIKYQPKTIKCRNYDNYNSDNINNELQFYNSSKVYDSESAKTS